MTRFTVAEAVALFGRAAVAKGMCGPCASNKHRQCERNAKPPKGCTCPKHESKYRAEPVVIDGVRFASKREAARYGELRMEYKAGRVTDLEMQVPFPLVVNDVHLCFYKADFVYKRDGVTVVEDSKGMRRGPVYDLFRLKKRLMLACHGIEVVEV